MKIFVCLERMKVPFLTYPDIKFLLQEKVDTCHRNPEKSSANKIKEDTAFGFSLFMHCSFYTANNIGDFDGHVDCM